MGTCLELEVKNSMVIMSLMVFIYLTNLFIIKYYLLFIYLLLKETALESLTRLNKTRLK